METTARPPIADTSVIVAVDGTADSARAIQWASHLARMQSRTLVLADTGPDVTAEDRLQLAAESAAALRLVTVKLEDDSPPANALAALASARGLLVVGAHRSGLLRSLFTKPLAESLANKVECPVVVVHPERRADVTLNRRGESRGVVVAVVGDDVADARLRFAYDYASWMAEPLTVLHCFWDVTHEVGLIVDTVTAPNEHRQLAEAVAGLGEDYPDVRVHLQLAHGFPERLIVEAGKHADMVVVGSDHVGRFSELVEGSLARWVLAHAECDVAIVPEHSRTPS